MITIKKISSKKLGYYLAFLGLAIAITVFTFWYNLSEFKPNFIGEGKATDAIKGSSPTNINMGLFEEEKLINLKDILIKPINLKVGKKNPYVKD